MKAMLLAAGEGTRLRPITEALPKPMVPVADKPILQHNVEMLARYGIREIAINLHHCPQVVTSHFGDGSRFGVSTTYSYEPELLGTAGAVKKLEALFSQDTFFVIYGDNLLKCDLERMLHFHRDHSGLATIALHYRRDVTQSGVVALDDQDRVTRFVEKPRAGDAFSHWVNAGILVLEPAVLQHIPPCIPFDFGKQVLPELLKAGEKLYGYRLTGDEGIWWIDTPDDLAYVQRRFQEAECQ